MLLREGHNCWRRLTAERLAFLVDAEAYYPRVADAIERAERSIYILCWDVHSRTRLRREGGEESELGALLDRVVRRKRRLHAYVLNWDFSMIYALEREPAPVYHFGWATHRRVHFSMDAMHPVGGSHHQKIVVIDDAVAFLGGLDLTVCRWDTCDHAADEPCRVDPAGKGYEPFHDVQVAVSGPPAAALGELARERWRRATGRLPRARGAEGDPWPPGLEPDLRDVEVGLARTDPGWNGRPAMREIERLYVDMLAAAERSIYIENQYFTSAAIGDALVAALERVNGPDVVIVLPLYCSGWLEESTMGVLRARLLRRLRQADRHGRLGVFYAYQDGLADDSFIHIHSKVCIVDDRALTVGSANLSNRSMGLDTECNLALEAGENGGEVARCIEGLRDRLLGEHLGVDPHEIERAVRDKGSLLVAVSGLCGEGRSLRPLPEPEASSWVAEIVPDAVDPERPIEASLLADRIVGDPTRASSAPSPWPLVALLAVAAGLALAWRFGPLHDWLEPGRMFDWVVGYRDEPTALLYSMGLYVAAGLVMFPVTLLIFQTALVFDPWIALVHAIAGSLASAAVTWTLGRLLGRGAVRRLAGRYSTKISRFMARRGLLTMAAVRLVPVAPYSLVNLVAGASGVPFGQFVAGTLIGMLPGIVAIAVLGDRALHAVRDPSWTSVTLFIAVLVTAVLLSRTVARRLRRRLQAGVETPRSPAD